MRTIWKITSCASFTFLLLFSGAAAFAAPVEERTNATPVHPPAGAAPGAALPGAEAAACAPELPPPTDKPRLETPGYAKAKPATAPPQHAPDYRPPNAARAETDSQEPPEEPAFIRYLTFLGAGAVGVGLLGAFVALTVSALGAYLLLSLLFMLGLGAFSIGRVAFGVWKAKEKFHRTKDRRKYFLSLSGISFLVFVGGLFFLFLMFAGVYLGGLIALGSIFTGEPVGIWGADAALFGLEVLAYGAYGLALAGLLLALVFLIKAAAA